MSASNVVRRTFHVLSPDRAMRAIIEGELVAAGLHAVEPDGRCDLLVAALPFHTFGEDDAAASAFVLRRAAEIFGRPSAPRAVLVLSSVDATGPRTISTTEEPADSRPIATRGRTFLSAENDLIAAAERSGAATVVARAGHLWGPLRPRFLSPIMRALRGDHATDVRRQWCDRRSAPLHVENLKAALRTLVGVSSGRFHVMDETPPTTGDFAAMLTEAADRAGIPVRRLKPMFMPPPSRGDHHFSFAPKRLTEAGYAPRISTARGVAELVAEGAESAVEASAERTDEIRRIEGQFWDEAEETDALMYFRPHDWAFDARVGNTLQRPTYMFLKRALRGSGDVLDLGCGGGAYARAIARHLGAKVVGVDLSPKKIEAARRAAEAAGLSHLCEFVVGDALTFATDRRFDAIVAIGALHHFPDVERHLPKIVERNLRPGGRIVAVDPHHEALAPAIQKFISRLVGGPLRRFFDTDAYERTTRNAARGDVVQAESPAGRIFHRDDFSVDAYLKSVYRPLRVRYQHVVAPFFANAFIVFQKSKIVRAIARALLPAVVVADRLLCRFERFSRYAALGLYVVVPKKDDGPLGAETRAEAPPSSPPMLDAPARARAAASPRNDGERAAEA